MNEGGNFTWSYLPGSDLKSRVVYPNGVTVDYSYEQNRDLLTNVHNHLGDTTYSEYAYANDALGRRTAKNAETYSYNDRNERTSASTGYAYTYDFTAINPYRFSSEYADDLLGLVYYNYRHYNPKDGRWLTYDRLLERGCLNLYIFLENQTLIEFDFLGDAPQYIYDGVMLTCGPDGMRIKTSPDWDRGDFDYYYGRPYRIRGEPYSLHTEDDSEGLDVFLDVAGCIDPTPICDTIHAIIYLVRLDLGNACVCVCSCLPLGDFAKAGKYGANGLKVVRQTRTGYKTAKEAAEAAANNRWRAVGRDTFGEITYTDGKHFYSRDTTQHKGGAWKMWKNKNGTGRVGTLDKDLNKIGD